MRLPLFRLLAISSALSNYCISRLNYDERITNRILERSLEIPFPEESVREHIAETMKQQMIAGIMGGGK